MSSTLAFASDTAISVSPAILEFVTTPDQTNTTKITLINNTDFPLPIKGQVSAFLGNNDLPKSGSDTYNAAAWFTLDPADFILQPLEQKEIQVDIIPPAKTEPGGHYATIYFQPLIPAEVVTSGSTKSLARVGVLAFLVVPGDIREGLEITSVSSPNWQTFGPINFDFALKNTGNIHLLPTGNIEIKNIFNQVVKTIPLDPSVIIPGTSREQSLVWEDQLLFGRYTARLTTIYGTGHDPLFSNLLIFWIIPWPIILIVIALLTLFYKIFIVHIDRVKLAIKVLKGKDLHETQNPAQSTSSHPRPRRRPHSSDPSTPRRRRR